MPMHPSTESLGEALRSAYPELDAIREQVSEAEPAYLVGGAVRDLLLGRGRSDLDLVVEGDAGALAARLGAEAVQHERFGTAKVRFDGHCLDIAAARSESYARPGALPTVRAPADIEADLARRDFTINAMAVPLAGEPRLIDPHRGLADLETGVLRVLHAGSFADDPTRAIRAARYAARFGFALEEQTAGLLARCDLSTVSTERREAELLRLAEEPNGPRGFELLAEWGLIEAQPEGIAAAHAVAELLAAPPWQGVAEPGRAVLLAALGPPGKTRELAASKPSRPSEAVEVAARHDPVELVLARALGAAWLDRWLLEWRAVSLEIDGDDLMAAGVPQGPAVGRGLQAALRGKLDGEVGGRAQELEAALKAAGEADGVA